MVERRVQVIAGDVGTDGLGLERGRRGDPRLVRHGDPLGRHGELRLPDRRRGRGQPARSHPRRPDAHRARRAPPPRRRVDLLRRRQPAGLGAGDPGRRQPVLERRRLAAGGRLGPPGAGRRRGREPRPRPARAVHGRSPARAGRRRLAAAVGEVRAAPGRLGEGPARRGRPGPGRVARLARRLRDDQGPRREGPRRDARRHPGVDRAARHHRVGPRRPRTRAGSAGSAWPSR